MRWECRERFPRHRGLSDPDMHLGTCVTHVPWCMPGSLNSGFLWSRWRGNRSRHSRRILQFYVSGKRPMLASMLVKQPRRMWVNKPHESIGKYDITKTKLYRSNRANCMGYNVTVDVFDRSWPSIVILSELSQINLTVVGRVNLVFNHGPYHTDKNITFGWNTKTVAI